MTALHRSIRPRAVRFVGDDDSDTRQVTVIATDATPDRMGDIVEPGGAQLENFKRNPVVLFSHDPTQPIARCPVITQLSDRIVATIQFPPAGVNAKSDEVLALIRANILSAVSIGFMPLEWDYLEGRGGGVRYTAWELAELSVVSVPANPSALVTQRALQRSAGERAATPEEMADFREALRQLRAKNGLGPRLDPADLAGSRKFLADLRAEHGLVPEVDPRLVAAEAVWRTLRW